MKIKGLFDECTLTRAQPIFSGITENGIAIYADTTDVEKGFQMFRNYTMRVFDETKDIPIRGLCHRSKIIRIPFFDFSQIPEWMRIEKIKSFLREKEGSGEDFEQAVASLEDIVVDRLFKIDNLSIPTLYV